VTEEGRIERVCAKCGESKSLDEYSNKKGGKYGKASACRDCERNRGKMNYLKTMQRGNIEYPNTYTMVCSKCNVEKKLTEFPVNKQGKYGRHSVCKSCVAIYHKKHYEKNYDSISAKHKEYQEQHREEQLARQADWRERNKEKLKEDRKRYYANQCH